MSCLWPNLDVGGKGFKVWICCLFDAVDLMFLVKLVLRQGCIVL